MLNLLKDDLELIESSTQVLVRILDLGRFLNNIRFSNMNDFDFKISFISTTFIKILFA